MTEFIGEPSDFSVIPKPKGRTVRIEPLVEIVKAQILGQEGSMLLVQLDILVDKEAFTFVGPLQCVKQPERKEESHITLVNIPLKG